MQRGACDPSAPAVRLDHVVREFHSARQTVRALDDLTLEIPRGQATALLGVNGAGKTTLSKVLATWIYPSSGTAQVFGYDVVSQSSAAARHVVPVFGGDLGLYPMLTGRENLRYFSAVRGRGSRLSSRETDQALEEVGLGSARSRRVEEYSKGMKQRLHLAIGLASDAPLVILDEPTAGLDPVEASRFRGTIRELIDSGRTLLLTSHNLADVEEVAERVLFLEGGRLHHDLPLDRFKALAGYRYRLVITTRRPVTLNGYHCEHCPDGTYRTHRLLEDSDLPTLSQMLTEVSGSEVLDLALNEPTLDEAFSVAAGA
nr:ABC transporter ATP-binding protein [Actinomyces sp.]